MKRKNFVTKIYYRKDGLVCVISVDFDNLEDAVKAGVDGIHAFKVYDNNGHCHYDEDPCGPCGPYG